MRRLTRPLWILLALVFLFEAWLWDRLQPVVAWVVGRLPWKAFKAKVAVWIERLPPAATLGVFLVPVVMLLPLKFAGLWMLAHGHVVGAGGVLVLAKVVSMGITAFIFDATRDKLLELGWFRWLYDHVMAWRDWAHALIDPIKLRIRARLRMFAPRRARRSFRLMLRIRRRMRERVRGELAAGLAGLKIILDAGEFLIIFP
jgi:hypothetical protein